MECTGTLFQVVEQGEWLGRLPREGGGDCILLYLQLNLPATYPVVLSHDCVGLCSGFYVAHGMPALAGLRVAIILLWVQTESSCQLSTPFSTS